MKRAHLTTILGWTIGVGLHLCGCRAYPWPEASSSPSLLDQSPQDRASGAGTAPAQTAPAPTPGQNLASPESPGTVRTVHEPMREIEGAPTGRVRLLEMYQAAVAQKNQLARRAADLTRERDTALARAADAEKTRAELEVRQTSLAAELRDLQAKALELARRLAQAELARLEAERAELESRTSDTGRTSGARRANDAVRARDAGGSRAP